MIRQPRWLGGLVIALLLLALPASTLGVHSHPEGNSKNCTLCQALHLPGSFATVPGLARPVACIERVLSYGAVPIGDTFASSLSSRGPPPVSTAS